MITLKTLVDYTDQKLSVEKFSDYCPNGLQVEGRAEVGLLVSGVTASLAFVEAAIEAGADAMLVHHGYFWKGEDARITGMKRTRLQRLLAADTSLLAYHLPLDAHPEFGNNAQLARRLDFTSAGSFGDDGGMQLGQYADLPAPIEARDMAALITRQLEREPLHIAGTTRSIGRIGWCTGAAQSYLEAAARQGLDAFISGEISEQTVHEAREYGMHYFAAGHHATERYGVQALGEHLAGQFGILHRFIDCENPV